MNGSKLIRRMASESKEMSLEDVTLGVKLIIRAMSTSLKQNGRVELRGFGSFKMNYRGAYRARNPRTGAGVEVAPRYLLRFKPGASLRNRVNKDATTTNTK